MKHVTANFTALAAVLLLASVLAGGLSAAEAVKPHRLWLPSSQSNLRGLLEAAANRALEDPDCTEVLYGRLNEYRTENEGTAFTILCMRDPRYTFNLVFHASELEPAESEPDRASNSSDLQRLRELLGDIPASVRAGAAGNSDQQEPEEPEDTSEPVLF